MKKSILTKFDNIAYPIFTLQKKPYEIIYEPTKIYCRLNNTKEKSLVDDKQLPGDYFNRLLRIKHRMHFDNTCKNLQALLWVKAQWGIDSKAIPHDLSKLYAVPAEKRLVVRSSGNLIWLKNISYPFEIPTQENISINSSLYATIVHVNGEWFLKEFSIEPKLKLPYKYV